MKIFTSWKRGKTDTIHGMSVCFTVVFQSFDPKEIASVEKQLSLLIGKGAVLVSDVGEEGDNAAD